MTALASLRNMAVTFRRWNSWMLIRLASPDRDAAAVAEIYRPLVEETAISFEEVAPTPMEMAERIRATLDKTPWLVADAGEEIIGYAYAGPHRQRAAYRWSVDVSAYVADEWRGRGVGRALYERLLVLLGRQGFFNVYAGVTLPNDASLNLHQAVGMQPIGVYQKVGYKFGRWWDVMWLGRRLTESPDPTYDPVPLPNLLTNEAPESTLHS